jgi:PAS domain S-box-containing protein
MKDDHKTKKQLLDELTALRLQNAALKESKGPEKYQSLIENLRDVVYALDSQGVVLYISPSVRDLLEYDSAEIVGKNFIELAYKDDQISVAEWFSELRKGKESPSEYRFSNKSGEIKWTRTNTRPVMEDGLFKGARGILIDVTAQKRAEEALRETNETLSTIVKSSPLAIIALDVDGNVIRWNPAAEEMFGWLESEALGHPLPYVSEDKRDEHLKLRERVLRGEGFTNVEASRRKKDGSYIDISISTAPLRDSQGRVTGVMSINANISERKQAEDALRESEEKYRELVKYAPAGIYEVDYETNRFTSVNDVICEYTGYSRDELSTMNLFNLLTAESQQLMLARLEKLMAGEKLDPTVEYCIRTKDGNELWGLFNARYIYEAGKLKGATGIIYDITKRKQAEDALKESEERYRSMLEEIEDGYQEVDLSGNFTFFNTSFRKIFGYNENELMGSNFRRYAADEENADKVYRAYNQMFKTGGPLKRFEWDIITKDGARRSIEFFASLLRDGEGHRRGFRGIVRDVTDRKFVEEQYRTMANSSQTGVYIVQDGRLCFVNPHIPSYSGYSEEELIGERVLHFVHPDDRKMVREMAGKMLAGKLTASYEYRIMDKNNQVKWLMETVTPISYKGRSAVLGNTMDVTERRQSEEKLQETLESLRKAIGATIQVMVSAVEARDPYTAGHQIRSANLARCIATEMGLPQEKIDGIRMAGSIHDIGKLSVPAEILSKPTRLTELEFSLIKEHSRQGYEMLKDVESPWPLAEIVHQHHERMDGSGYPRNLKGEEILMEARILAVADVVESMASHRPYRPAIGIEPALEEIEKNKGILYDDAVADACLRLFREKGFRLE